MKEACENKNTENKYDLLPLQVFISLFPVIYLYEDCGIQVKYHVFL